MSEALGRFDGWIVARQNALLTIGHARDVPLTAAGALALGRKLNHWARDPDLYAVLLDESTLALQIEPSAAAAAMADLIWRFDCFSKPTIAVMNGPVGDLGYALALAGTHQVAGPAMQWQSTALTQRRLPSGLLPWTLARQPAAGSIIPLPSHSAATATDVWRSGLATHYSPPHAFATIVEGLAAAEPVDALLDALHAPPSPLMQPTTIEAADATSIPGQLFAYLLAEGRGLERSELIALACRYDQALVAASTNATLNDVHTLAAGITLNLPTRRELQAFRKT